MTRCLVIPFLAVSMLSNVAAAQDMRRCQRIDGSIIYTDRQCQPDQSEKPADTAAAPLPRSGRIAIATPPACSSTVDDLLYNVRSAIDSHDVNLLARSYHWPDLGDAQVESILNRLDTLVQQPLVNIRLLFAKSPEAQTDIEPDSGNTAEISGLDQEQAVPAAVLLQAPYGLKVLLYASATDSRIVGTAFGLHRHFDCWWIRY